MRGAAPPVHPSALPEVGAGAPTPPSGGRSAPPTPGHFSILRGAAPPVPPSALPEVGAGAPTPPRAGAPPRAPGDFLMRRKSPKTHQEPPGSWTSGTRGRTPLDSPAFCPSGIGRGNLNPQASSGASHPPSHGLKAESVPSMKPEEKTRPICPLSSKWQIGLGLWQKVARRDAQRARKGR